MGRHFSPSKLLRRVGVWTPSNRGSLGLRESTPDGTSIGSAVFAGLMIVTDRPTRSTDRSYYTVCNNGPHVALRCSPKYPITVSQKTPHLWLAITLMHIIGTNVTSRVDNQKTLYYATSSNLCFCTTWQNADTRKSHFSPNWIVLHTHCTCALSSWKKTVVICDVFDSV